MYYKRFQVTGLANVTELDDGLVSLVEEPYHINAILITIDEPQDNVLEGWIGTERVLEIPDYVLDNQAGLANNPRSTTKLTRIPVDLDIPPGQIFKVGIRCGTAVTIIYGAYEYVKIT